MPTNYDRRPVNPLQDAWLLDPNGVIVGVEIAHAGNQKTYFLTEDGSITTDVIGNLTGDVTGNVTGDVTGNVTGDLTGNVTAGTITATGAVTLGAPTGFFGNLSTVVAGTPGLTLVENSQMVMYSPFTVENAVGVTFEGEMRVYSWPA